MAITRKISRILFWSLIAFIVLLLAMRLFASQLIKQGVVSWFEQQQLQAKVEEININLSQGSFAILGLEATKQGQQVLKLDRFSTRWSWSALLDSSAKIHSIKIDGLAFDIEQLNEQQLIIAGIDIAALAEQSSNEPQSADNQPVEWTASLNQLELTNFAICYRQADIHDYCSQFKKLAWQGNIDIDLAKLSQTALPVFSRGRLDLEAFKIHNNKLDRDLVEFAKLSLHDVEIDTPALVSINRIELNSLSLLRRQPDELAPQVSTFEEIGIAYLNLEELKRLRIKDITINEHQVLVIKQPDNTLEIDEWIPASSQATTDDDPKMDDTTTADADVFQYAIEKIIYETSKSIQYRDNSLKMPFAVDLNTIKIKLENLDNSKPEQDSKVSYSAQYGKHGKISLDGTAKPLMVKPSFNMVGKIAGLDLRDLSAFTGDAIGHTIKSGQLDADLKLVAINSVLDSEVDLKLYHFELTALSSADEDKLNADFGYPLNTSLSLLKDSDNTIELNIPITGDLQNPDFNANDAITKATSSAITSAIISYYTPFGLVMAVEGLIDLATALDFEPVKFAAGNNVLEASEHNSLKKLAQLMQEKPGIHLTLCAFSNSADRAAIFPETAAIPLDQLKLEAEQPGKLAELGETRAAAVKQYLVDQKVEASRLVLCTPAHDEGDGLSGVEVSI